MTATKNTSAPNSRHGKSSESPPVSKSPGFLSVAQSVLAAMFGVQSERKREQDFTQGKASDYIIVAIVFVLLFVVGLIWLVNLILAAA